MFSLSKENLSNFFVKKTNYNFFVGDRGISLQICPIHNVLPFGDLAEEGTAVAPA